MFEQGNPWAVATYEDAAPVEDTGANRFPYTEREHSQRG